jgi:polysaccharide biosynthesis transport protein
MRSNSVIQSNPDYIEELNIQKYWLVVKRRWKPAMLTFTTFAILSTLFAISRKPTYEAKGQVLIERDKASKLVGLDSQMGDIDVLTNQSNPISTEAEIIRSRPIVQETIKELNITQEPGKLPGFIEQINTQFNSSDRESKLVSVKDFLRKLDVKAAKGTDLLEVSYEDKDPELAARVVNKIILAYKDRNALNNKSETSAVRKFIVEELPKLEANVNKAEDRLLQFKSQNKLVNLSAETNKTITTVQSLEAEINQTAVELKDINARSAEIRHQLGMNLEEAKVLIAVSQSEGIKRTLTELQEVKIEATEANKKFSGKAPQLVELKERESELELLLKQQISKTIKDGKPISLQNINVLNIGELRQDQIKDFVNIEIKRAGLNSRSAALQENLNAYQEKLEARPKLEKQQRELENKLEAAQSTYQTLLKKLQETQVAENQKVGNVRIIAEAVPPEKPSSTSKQLVIGAGIISGACFGVLVAFLIDIFDRTLKNRQEAEELFGYPLYAIIPKLGESEKNEREMGKLPASSSSIATEDPILRACGIEAYQILRTNLKTISASQSTRVIAVTSSVPQEGKSEVSANLAAAIAAVGQKVLLIDADMRLSTQHTRWRLSNQVGLSNILEHGISWKEVRQEVTPCLDVITAGENVSNPIALIDSHNMKALIETVADHYDYVIFDTPPLVGIADTTILGKMTHGTLMVARPGTLDYSSALDAKKILEKTEQNVVGMVVNGENFDNTYYKDFSYLDKNKKEQNTRLLGSRL